jgi:clan AA aspartic protease
MTGSVDGYGRALLKLVVRHPVSGNAVQRDAWIDTGFTGELLLPEDLVLALSLPRTGAMEAALSDGTRRQLATHRCEVDWMGSVKVLDAVSSPNRFLLLGVQLLEDPS